MLFEEYLFFLIWHVRLHIFWISLSVLIKYFRCFIILFSFDVDDNGASIYFMLAVEPINVQDVSCALHFDPTFSSDASSTQLFRLKLYSKVNSVY